VFDVKKEGTRRKKTVVKKKRKTKQEVAA